MPYGGLLNPRPPSGGLLGGFGQRLNQGIVDNSGMLAALGAGLLAHRQNATNPLFGDPQTLLYAQAGDRQQVEKRKALEEERRKANLTRDYAINTLGMDLPTVDALDASGQLGATVFAEIDRRRNPPKPDYPSIYDEYLLARDDPGFAAFRAGQADLPDVQENYERAVRQGYKGTFLDYQLALKGEGVTVNVGETGPKLPPGYVWRNPSDPLAGVDPLPGGPATVVPGEQAARIGLAESFQSDLPTIQQGVAAGGVTGLIDNPKGRWGIGEQGRLYARIESGVDALRRSLTGAGMPAEEAADYARRYLPGIMDDRFVVADKLRQLEQELQNIENVASRGRTATPPASTNLRKKYGLE